MKKIEFKFSKHLVSLFLYKYVRKIKITSDVPMVFVATPKEISLNVKVFAKLFRMSQSEVTFYEDGDLVKTLIIMSFLH